VAHVAKSITLAECTETSRESFYYVNCYLSGHASWERLCLTFLEACKCMEGVDPKHTYKFFPSCDAWTWEQELHFKDLLPPSWHGLGNNLPNWGHMDWQDEHLTPHMTGPQCTRNHSWPSHLNAAGPAEQAGMALQDGPQVASRQSRLDKFPPTATSGETCRSLYQADCLIHVMLERIVEWLSVAHLSHTQCMR